MLKDKDTQPTLFQEDSHVNHSQLQENEEEQTMIVTSGMKLLELLPKQNQNGLLEKMLKGLLISTTAWYSDRCKLIWKKKVSKSNVLLYQLQASVHGIKEKEFGFWATPNTMDYLPPRSKEGTLKLQQGHRKGRTKPSNLREQVDPITMAMYPTPTQDSASERTKKYKQGGTPLTVAVKMFPTPTVGCEEGGEQSKRVEQTKSGAFILRKKNKPNSTFGAKLSDAMLYLEKHKMLPTPTNSEHKYRLKGNTQASKCLEAQARKAGGKLSPNFVEFLMGYPMNWTKIDPTE